MNGQGQCENYGEQWKMVEDVEAKVIEEKRNERTNMIWPNGLPPHQQRPKDYTSLII